MYVSHHSFVFSQVPGRDIPWDMSIIWQYLQHRAKSCKPETIKAILTKLGRISERYKHILPTSRFDCDPYGYRSVTKMKRQLFINAQREADGAGEIYEAVDRCTPIGKRGVSMLLSAFGISSEARFNALPRRDRHHVVTTVMQHAGGMRFGGLPKKDYTLNDFTVTTAGDVRLITDWSRYHARQFCIEFPAKPRFECMWYNIYALNGDLIDVYPASTILHWHFQQLRGAGEQRVFAPDTDKKCTRTLRQDWLHEVLFAALPIQEREARGLVDSVTTHSFRPGLADNLYREGVSLQRIESICRWNSHKVVRLYAERPCLSAVRLTNGFFLIITL